MAMQAKRPQFLEICFVSEKQKVMTLSAFRSMWKLIERELPETHITAHILRHTYITRLF